MAGRRSKYEPDRVKRILDALRNGMSVKGACAAGIISSATYFDWLKRHPEFSAAVTRAEKDSEMELVRRLYAHADDDWRAAKFLLERRFSQWQDGSRTSQENRDSLDKLKILKNTLEVKYAALKVQSILSQGEEDYELVNILNEIQYLEEKTSEEEEPQKTNSKQAVTKH